ncbi:pyruvate, phosphate dikinase [Aliifodinibius sp. S!AR15-10]|uniref:pyruvate, phosphate dikinase n=1 Tax=Aliifodinibius sp. S!AR15-10 TaxID=2950437 RepID=UPI0028573A46|nr:pyruvate, phosphate dikinase [Aliifodinibius sp. S!AR15-10]MDR8393175.1 pyruvate, phosphate dikinase [Aliifodinibius sp. S!AR15-10]
MDRKKMVYKFGGGSAEGDRAMKQLLGGKGANLAEMSSIGLPIPPGFTISTEVCQYYSKHKGDWPEGLEEQVQEAIHHIEDLMDLEFGDSSNPLLVSVRSGAAQSMPGMMDTVLNLGLNDKSVQGLAAKTDNERFAFDCYRRFIDMFGGVVMQVPHEEFEEAIQGLKDEKSVELDTELGVEDMKELVDRYKAVYRKSTGHMFPQNPSEQLHYAINAVFGSWDSNRAIKYRRINKITGLLGTAVNVQAMVYGNMGDDCATGVCFTRNPSDGTNELYGEFLINAQGEDVVAGIRTPRNINELKEVMSDTYHELREITHKLERHYQDMQDIEFTIQQGKLFILQTRNGKRTGKAAVKIAIDMVDEVILKKDKAVENLVQPNHLDQLLHPQLDESSVKEEEILGKGLPASPGAAVGKVVFDSETAEEMKAEGESVILVRIETSPEDVGGMSASEGILTSRGGMTSHAAVVARGWGKPCVAGCGDIIINYENQIFTNGKVTVHAGDWISIDGAQGMVINGKKEVEPPKFDDNYHTFMKWVDTFRDMDVRTNADTPEDAAKAREYGAQGIGLARTEHMFFGDERIKAMRRMIISESEEERRSALEALLPYQKQDFIEIFEAMEGLPVTVRLLDPPLHEFLPDEDEEIAALAEDLGIKEADLKRKIRLLSEFNPMLGHRGCRLGITYPEITEMQARAILEAAVEIKKQGKEVQPEIMIPLVGTSEEFIHERHVIDEIAEKVFEEAEETVEFKVGTMIEIPRAAIVADKIASEAEFFSFGTNDLTQMTFGYSRDDAGKFLELYLNEGILKHDPFQVLDEEGVGSLVRMAVEKGHSVKPDLKMGICGEHGGDPSSVAFCYSLGLNYVSCSPYRVPVARLAAAQARLRSESTASSTRGEDKKSGELVS